jgi:hypothetical protein
LKSLLLRRPNRFFSLFLKIQVKPTKKRCKSWLQYVCNFVKHNKLHETLHFVFSLLLPICLNCMLQMYILVMNGFAFHFWTLFTCYRFPNLRSNRLVEPKPSKIMLESFKNMVSFPPSIFITCCYLLKLHVAKCAH